MKLFKNPLYPKSFKKEDREEYLKQSKAESSKAIIKVGILGIAMLSIACFLNYASGKEISLRAIVLAAICSVWIAFTYFKTFR